MATINHRAFFYSFGVVMLAYISITTYLYIYQLSAKSRLVYLENYRSVSYGLNMLKTLPILFEADTNIQYMSQQLRLQQSNLTEIGEKPLTDSLSYFLDMLLQAPTTERGVYRQSAERCLYQIIELNQAATIMKMQFSQRYNQTALLWVGVQLGIGLLIAGIFWWAYSKIRKNNQIEQLKNNFISNISHELKTPISTIKLSLQLLENQKTGRLNQQQNELLAQIADDINRLLKITNELLNISQLEAGKISLNLQKTDIKDLLQYAVKTLQPMIQQKQLRVRARIDEKLPLLYLDGEKTSWVLLNLLGNAIRYSPADGIIDIEANIKANLVCVSIRDYGQGVPKAYQDRIFERYFQAPNPKNHSAGTAGVGLAISKEFIEAQGGKINLDSSIDKGAKFCVWLPNIH